MINHPSVYQTIEELRADLGRLRRDNADLRASALLWMRLYEQLLTAEIGADIHNVAGAQRPSSPSVMRSGNNDLQ